MRNASEVTNHSIAKFRFDSALKDGCFPTMLGSVIHLGRAESARTCGVRSSSSIRTRFELSRTGEGYGVRGGAERSRRFRPGKTVGDLPRLSNIMLARTVSDSRGWIV